MTRIKGKTGRSAGTSGAGYLDDVHRPISSLVFLLPMVVVYEIGTYALASNLPGQMGASEAANTRVIALELLEQFFALFGATTFYLPGLAIVAVLIAWQLASGEAWTIRWRTVLTMGVESLMLAIPLIVLSHVSSSCAEAVNLSAGGQAHGYLSRLLLSIGAGIYEEMLFRLMLISLLSVILVDVIRVPEGPSIFLIVLMSAVMFSLYHYLGAEAFSWSSFVFRAMAGGYLAGVFILRGFGIVVGCHVIYDLITVVLNEFTSFSFS